VVEKSTIGDSFPDSDWHPAPSDLVFGMGQFAKYMYVLPSSNLTVVSIGQSYGQSQDCDGAYNDGFTLSLVWRVMEAALGLGPHAITSPTPAPGQPAPAESELPLAEPVGVPQPGVRTRQTIRDERARHERRRRRLAAADATVAAAAANHSSSSSSAGRPSNTSNGLGGETGCCTCVCPPGQGFGRAFPASAPDGAPPPPVRETLALN
jgi:hypothetical protein